MRHIVNISTKTILKAIFVGSTVMLISCSDSKTDAKPAQAANTQSKSLVVKHVDAHGAQALLSANPQVVVLDVRSPKEIEDGHIEGAVFANFFDDDFKQQLTRFEKDTHYLVHCKGGGRSTKALATLEELGFTNITHMDGGLDDWKRADLPLSKP